MLLNNEQIKEIESIFISKDLKKDRFQSYKNEGVYLYKNRNEQTIFFVIKETKSALFAYVYCQPYTYAPTIYKGCNSFLECLKLAREWAEVTKYKLAGKEYYHKIFISHSSDDQVLIDEFVNKVLRLSCGFNIADIVYTSRQSTGVELGEGIPPFIKSNLQTSSLILFMISSNYRSSEACLNEMGAAWGMGKKTVSLVLPNTPFTSIGWLKSLDKAIKIDDGEGLDKLYLMLGRIDSNMIEWNIQKKSFLTDCKKWNEKDAIPKC